MQRVGLLHCDFGLLLLNTFQDMLRNVYVSFIIFRIIQHVKINNPCEYMNTLRDMSLDWRHNERNGVSNHRRLDCLINRLFRRISKKTPKLRVTGLCEGNPPVTGGFPSQRASNEENVSIRWRHHVLLKTWCPLSPGHPQLPCLTKTVGIELSKNISFKCTLSDAIQHMGRGFKSVGLLVLHCCRSWIVDIFILRRSPGPQAANDGEIY